MRPALLVIDVQNAWMDNSAELKESVHKRLGVMNEAIRRFREGNLPVIVIYHENREEGVFSGNAAFEFPDTVEIKEDDLKVTKHYANSFNKTGLESLLRKKGCDSVLIVGLSASGCALATYFGAMDCDFDSYLVRGGVASHSEEHIRIVEEICDTLSVDEFSRRFQDSGDQVSDSH